MHDECQTGSCCPNWAISENRLYRIMCSGLISSPSPMRIVARSIALRSSRTFPGQLCCARTCNASLTQRHLGWILGGKGESQLCRDRPFGRAAAEDEWGRRPGDNRGPRETAVEPHGFQVGVGGRNHAHIDLQIVVAAQCAAPRPAPETAGSCSAATAAYRQFHRETACRRGPRECARCATAPRR